MKIIIGESTNPYFNLAMEEYFLKEKQDDFFMLWRNDRSVIIGKNQNAYAEINHNFVTENNIKVVRRMTGGGAVFHDLGNVNYTFIKRDSKDNFNNYSEFCSPIIKFLNTMGINAKLSGRNDMLIDDKKFSGNAQYAYANSIMHHGTLLFSSEMNVISDALNVNPLKIKSKGISSVRSRVTNISEHLQIKMDVKDFISGLENYITKEIKDSSKYIFVEDDFYKINKLVEEKYSTLEWNFGFKQEYSIFNEKKFSFGLVQVNLNIIKNKIEALKITGDFFGVQDISKLENILKGVNYTHDVIEELLSNIVVDDYIKGMTAEELIELLFV